MGAERRFHLTHPGLFRRLKHYPQTHWEEEMNVRKLTLILLALLFAAQVAALTIDELQELYYQTENAEEFAAQAGQFIEEHDDPGELEHALLLWNGLDEDASLAWLDAKLQSGQADPKYGFLRLLLLEDPLAKLQSARTLIDSHPDYEGGYRALLLTYAQDFDPNDLEAPDGTDHELLAGDLPLLKRYAEKFSGSGYARMARVYQVTQSGDLEAAKMTLRESVKAGDAWVDDIGVMNMFPPAKWAELLACQIEALRENDSDSYTKYRIAELAGDLVDLLFNQNQDYEAVIKNFGAEPWYWENQYVAYALAMSYLELDQPARAVDLLTGNGDLNLALPFQDAWLSYNSEQAVEAYARILGPMAEDPVNAYLIGRSLSDSRERLKRAHALVEAHPLAEQGYSLAAETYLKHFSSTAADDPERAAMNEALKADAQLLRNFYFRFPQNHLATIGYFLANLAENDDGKALRAYQELHEAGFGETIARNIAKFTLEAGKPELLLLIKEYDLGQLEENAGSSEAELKAKAGLVFCQALLDGDYYQDLIAETAKHPDWMDNPEIQFMVVNAHYFRDDFTQTIATLRLMVEKGTIGTTMLNSLSDRDLTTHKDWKALLDLASGKPDPDAEQLKKAEAAEKE